MKDINISVWQLSIATIIVPVIPGSQIGIELYNASIARGFGHYMAVVIGIAAFVGVESVGAGAFYNATRLYNQRELDTIFYLSIAACIVYIAAGMAIAWSTTSLFFILSGVAYFNYSVYQNTEENKRNKQIRIEAINAEKNLVNAQVRLERARTERSERSVERERTFGNEANDERERSKNANRSVQIIIERSGGKPFKRTDVEGWAEVGKTSAAKLIKDGLTAGEFVEAGRHQYQYVNGKAA